MHVDLCALGNERSFDRLSTFVDQWKGDSKSINSASKFTVLLLQERLDKPITSSTDLGPA